MHLTCTKFMGLKQMSRELPTDGVHIYLLVCFNAMNPLSYRHDFTERIQNIFNIILHYECLLICYGWPDM
jgi:hypothetical protein